MQEKKLEQLMTINEQLMKKNQYAHQFFVETVKKDESYEPNFYETVKPFTDEITSLTSIWKGLALTFIHEYKPNQIFPNQIDQTVDNFENVAIKTFYPKTSLKIQLETYKSVAYVLNQLSDALKTKGN
ncbi:YppE family protein [Alkalihalobacillus pseudalcaliphilus]|uniref:YppE family protein n=1 Tax=Alkalihalobacillus pseudalcaliphilus TaxID=79884 RepID=UPI00064DC6DB|nr:YppE family protein [Alkalihalobacillus pseudalcaliphilus]KMK76397.1 hypothetical protein AB990_14495 [Alkalihalobacillus pseudalcaliphilus]